MSGCRFKDIEGVIVSGGMKQLSSRYDPEFFDELREYAKSYNISLSSAVTELTIIGLETIKEAKTDAIIRRVREKERALKVSKSFDFAQDCYACGRHGTLSRVHGHIQCRVCGANVEPCCDD